MSREAELLKLLLPEYLINYLEVVNFEEKSTIPNERSTLPLCSKGFHHELTVDDFPLREKSVKLHIKRRRWTDISTG